VTFITGKCIIDVTAWAYLTVYFHLSPLHMIFEFL